MPSKACTKCGEVKDLADFYKQPNVADGRAAACKECAKAAVRANRAAKIDHYRGYDRERAMRPDRVAMRDAYQKTAAGKAAVGRAKRSSNARNPERRAARVKLGNALRDGQVSKPVACWHCGSDDRIHGHHADYSRPLAVSWICQACHVDVHRTTDLLLNASACIIQ